MLHIWEIHCKSTTKIWNVQVFEKKKRKGWENFHKNGKEMG